MVYYPYRVPWLPSVSLIFCVTYYAVLVMKLGFSIVAMASSGIYRALNGTLFLYA